MAPIIVLFTDFGLEGPYTGQVKTVLHQIAPGVPVVDLFADLPAAKPRPAAYLLAAYGGWFPPGTIFLAVVDPGVGGERAAVVVDAGARWYVGPDNGLLELVMRRAGRALKLERIPMDLLCLLVRNAGQLVGRDTIIERLWGKDIFLDTDNSINTAVRKIRQILNDDPRNPKFVQTVPGKGYRFAALVTDGSRATSDLNRSLELSQRVMLAVLPFENLSNDMEQEYFSDGLTEETISYLGQLDPQIVGVIARTSSMAYKRTTKTIAQIGRELGVNYVVEGSVRMNNNDALDDDDKNNGIILACQAKPKNDIAVEA